MKRALYYAIRGPAPFWGALGAAVAPGRRCAVYLASCGALKILGVGATMTLDKSLRRKRSTSAMRSVLTRGERITRLQSADRWSDAVSPYGLPKVRVYKLTLKKKKKKKEGEEETAAVAPAAAGKGAPAKGAAAKAAPAKPAAGKPAAGGKAGGKK